MHRDSNRLTVVHCDTRHDQLAEQMMKLDLAFEQLPRAMVED